MNEKHMSEDYARMKKALGELKGIFGFDEDKDDEMKHEEICTELDALADEFEQIERKAEMLMKKVLGMDLNSDGAARIIYGIVFMTKLNASAQVTHLRSSTDFIRYYRPEDER